MFAPQAEQSALHAGGAQHAQQVLDDQGPQIEPALFLPEPFYERFSFPCTAVQVLAACEPAGEVQEELTRCQQVR